MSENLERALNRGCFVCTRYPVAPDDHYIYLYEKYVVCSGCREGWDIACSTDMTWSNDDQDHFKSAISSLTPKVFSSLVYDLKRLSTNLPFISVGETLASLFYINQQFLQIDTQNWFKRDSGWPNLNSVSWDLKHLSSSVDRILIHRARAVAVYNCKKETDQVILLGNALMNVMETVPPFCLNTGLRARMCIERYTTDNGIKVIEHKNAVQNATKLVGTTTNPVCKCCECTNRCFK